MESDSLLSTSEKNINDEIVLLNKKLFVNNFVYFLKI